MRSFRSSLLQLPTSRKTSALALLLAVAGLVSFLTSVPASAQSAQEAGPPQIQRDGWKDCEFNLQVIGCRDQQLANYGLRIIWKDGLRMDYKLVGDDLLRDTLGGLWRRQVLVQGNLLLKNTKNTNRILIPLRYTCKPPLKGQVGYCRE
jgi:hypothetical protein